MIRSRLLLKNWRYAALLLGFLGAGFAAQASSHREAPLIANDPMADNTDVYAFRSPDDTNTVTIIADYIPFQLPEGGPNYYNFSPNVRYEIHIKNKATVSPGNGDDITYRFTFSYTNQDTTTFFNIRLGKQNLKTSYICERSNDGGQTFTTIVNSGTVPPNNIGPRSILNATVGLGAPSYLSLMQGAIATATGTGGEKVFAGPVDDPFFVDLAGAFDLGNFRPSGNTTNPTKDGLARYNVHSIALKIPISGLQQAGKNTTQASSILDGTFVIGVWASASRQQIKTLAINGAPTASGNWVQVSRLGMPLTNEAIIPIGSKDKWNASNPSGDVQYAQFYSNPELALYMDESKFASAVPALNQLRIQKASLGAFDFRNGHKGLYGVKSNPNNILNGTAFDPALPYLNILIPDSMSPRAVDILPIFLTGVPNLPPYQLALTKNNNPFAAGKPFINNFLPTLGDMLRLNMAVPVTSRTSSDFSTLGIVGAAAYAFSNPNVAANPTGITFIPNMDGFPNGRRLEDDVTTIELQAVGGVALAAIGLFYDDYYVGVSTSGVTARLGGTLAFTAGPTHNDTTYQATFPYVQQPWRGFDYTLQARF